MKLNELDRRLEKYNERKQEVARRRDDAITYKKQIIEAATKTLSEHRKDKLSYSEYRYLIENLARVNKKDWINYYDSYVRDCDNYIDWLDSKIRELERQKKFRNWSRIAVTSLVILALLAVVYTFGSEITGYVTAPINVTILNVKPNVSSVTISPTTAYTNNTLTCNPNTEDWNGDTVTKYYLWFSNKTAGQETRLGFNIVTLASGNFSGNHRVRCQVTPYDGSLNGTAKNASITIGNRDPVIEAVNITDNGASFSLNAVNPIKGTTANVAIRVTVNDGDCSNENNVTAYICDVNASSTCSNTNYNYSKVLTFQRTAGGSSCHFNFNGSTGMPQFWKQAGTWNITAYADDNSSNGTTKNRFRSFTYNSLQAINYVSRLYLGNSTITLGSWSTNFTAVNVTNYGNVVLNLTWNASNPTRLGGGGTWTINNDFQIDDDKVYSGFTDDTLRKFLNLSSTRKDFFPATGLQRCTNSNCNTGAYPQFTRNETLPTYFHIKPPTGLASGTYSTTIWIVTNSFP